MPIQKSHQYLLQIDSRKQRGSRTVQCGICKKWFCRKADKARHKCVEEQNKPVEDQQGSAQSPIGLQWFRSRGGLAVHNCHCSSETEEEYSTQSSSVTCSVCNRSFSRQADLKRQKCKEDTNSSTERFSTMQGM